MLEYCDCKEWTNLIESYDLLTWESPYGWLLKWIQITEEKGYSQIHRYGIPIKFCPYCGKELRDKLTK